MRLDHLLSKENRVFVLSLCGCWLAPGWWQVFVIAWCRLVLGGGKFLFSGEDRYRTHFVCVVLGVDETRTFCGLSALIGCKGFCRVTSVFVFRLCLMVCFVLWHAVGCLEQHECCSVDHPW